MRIGRTSGEVRRVLSEFVRFGAPAEILLLGKPHLGTDRLVKILKNLRDHLEANGVVFHFGTRVEDIELDPVTNSVKSITVRETPHRSIKDTFAEDGVCVCVCVCNIYAHTHTHTQKIRAHSLLHCLLMLGRYVGSAWTEWCWQPDTQRANCSSA
jgi:hypothetical protein